MKRQKVFWVTFLAALAVLAPVYAFLYFGAVVQGRQQQAPAAEAQSGVGVDKPQPGDSRRLFVAVKGAQPLFLVLRLDAFQGRASVAVVRPDTLVLTDSGGVQTLQTAWEYAGPGYASERLCATLGVTLDHYIQMNESSLVEMGAAIGPVRLDGAALKEAGAESMGVGSNAAALSAQNIADLMAATELPAGQKAAFLGQVMAMFLATGSDRLATLLPDLLRSSESGLSTSIFATEIYDYEKILGYFDLAPPQVVSFTLPGTETDRGFELAENAPEKAAEYLE